MGEGEEERKKEIEIQLEQKLNHTAFLQLVSKEEKWMFKIVYVDALRATLLYEYERETERSLFSLKIPFPFKYSFSRVFFYSILL